MYLSDERAWKQVVSADEDVIFGTLRYNVCVERKGFFLFAFANLAFLLPSNVASPQHESYCGAVSLQKRQNTVFLPQHMRTTIFEMPVTTAGAQ